MRAKVVHVITQLEFGGAQQNTLHTVANLDPERFEVVLASGPGGVLDDQARVLEQREHPVRVRFFEDLVREISPFRDLITFFQLYAFFAAERPAIVHTHSSKAGILGRFAARLAGVPLIVHTFHGFAFHERMHPWLKAFYAFTERLAGRCSTRLVFVSKANRAYAAAHGLCDPARFELIRSGIKLSNYPAGISDRKIKRASIGVRRDPPLVISVANLKPQKNALDFLRVAEAVAKEVRQVSFLYIGDGPMRSRFEAVVLARKLSRVVTLLGWSKDVAEILAASDLFILTSLWEGLPRSLVEALKTGLPCVAYDVDGVGDVLEDGVNGYTVEPGDWKTAADRIKKLVEDEPLRRRMGRKAGESIGAEFDIDEMVRRQETLYDELLAGWAGPNVRAAA